MVDSYINSELVNTKIARLQQSHTLHTSPIGIIPKSSQPGKFRLIVDLSAPKGFSINDGVSSELCSLEYTSVDVAASLVERCGRNAWMAKLDLQSAYRMVPVHPYDRPLLAIKWRDRVYEDHALPFGLRSAPKIFTAVADGLAWALIQSGITVMLHYLDDFFFCCPNQSNACKEALDIAVPLCKSLGLPVAPHKVVGPKTVLSFLGIIIDSERQELRLPADKLSSIKALLRKFLGKRSATKHELQCLIGHLNHAARVVKPGRTFLREVISTMTIPKHSYHRVRLNVHCRADIAWWAQFCQSWNGIAFFPNMPAGLTSISDASGAWGCGAFVKQSNQWFQLQWPPAWSSKDIAVKEMVPIVISTAIWGRSWSNSTVTFRSDNMTVVHTLSKGSSRDPHLSHLLRCLFFFEAHFKFEHTASHIPGKLNVAADALSRNNATTFFSLSPQVHYPPPSIIPSPLTELLLNQNITWISPHWKVLFQATLDKV